MTLILTIIFEFHATGDSAKLDLLKPVYSNSNSNNDDNNDDVNEARM